MERKISHVAFGSGDAVFKYAADCHTKSSG